MADDQIVAIAAQLRSLKAALGSDYWQDRQVLELQQRLRQAIGGYGAWAEDRPPMHQRSRQLAKFESEFAALLWPGRSDN